MALQKYSINQEKNDQTMSVSMKNLMKNDQQGVSLKAAAQSGDGGIVGVMMGVSVVGGVIIDVVSGIVVGIVPNKITRPAGVPMLSSDESDEIEINE
nr:hypothetical protein [Tanacetum cinerariifolium]